MEPILRCGEVVPSFTLPDTAGQVVRRAQYRGRQHLALVFLPSAQDAEARAYLRALADEYLALRDAGGTALVILQGDADEARVARAELDLPFRLLIDAEGVTAARFMPAEARAGVFVTDRYGELYYTEATAETAKLPPVGELRKWLEAIDRQCAI